MRPVRALRGDPIDARAIDLPWGSARRARGDPMAHDRAFMAAADPFRCRGVQGFVNPGSGQLFDSDRSWRLVLIFCLVNSSMHNLPWLLIRPLESFQSYNVQKICVNKLMAKVDLKVKEAILIYLESHLCIHMYRTIYDIHNMCPKTTSYTMII
ncbi:uncharacterized protein [Triticum aestivum]|uniref:uncharacterized protein isoform X2 n=2 Tax=Triticum aestivum TaxID=4565 RepID=UPI001D02CCAD|nr:uncharacterized protein LOC123179984 isoform X2 [Triticum aestivum]